MGAFVQPAPWWRRFVVTAAVVATAVGLVPPGSAAHADGGTLQIRGMFDVDAPVPAGSVVRIDGADVGVTDESGSLTVVRPPGEVEVSVVVPSLARGAAPVTVVEGETAAVDVEVADEGEQAEASTLTLDELVDGGLDLATGSITFRFRRPADGTPVAVAQVEQVNLETPLNPTGEDLTPLFGVGPDGAVVATDVAAVTGTLADELSAVTLSVQGTDAQGFTYAGAVDVAPGLHRVTVALQAPPSKPGLPVAGLTAQVRYGTVDTAVTTDADGRFVLEKVPAGPVSVSASSTVDGAVFTGFADPGVRNPGVLTVTMLGVDDVLAGVAPWRFDAEPAPAASAQMRQRRLQQQPAAVKRMQRAKAAASRAAADDPVSVFVAGGPEYSPQTGNARLTVPQGTAEVTVSYEVRTEEYPDFVEGQSRYNDTWGVSVLLPDGRVAFSVSRSVNSQLYEAPTFDDNGSTGLISQQIDVSALTADSDAMLTLAAVSTNIGDEFLPAEVTATLSSQPAFGIAAIRNDTIPPHPRRPGRVVHDRFSIPRPGQANTRQRRFDVDFTGPAGVTITGARVDLVNVSNPANPVVLQTVTNGAPTPDGANGVRLIDADTVRVRSTFDAQHLSTVSGTPPAASRIRYRIRLTGRDATGAVVTAVQNSAAYFPLWRMPDGFARYGNRDTGGDDWCSAFTYNWMANHRNLVARINDVSGEHGRNLDHRGHLRGRDLDVYHVYNFPAVANPAGRGAATLNYLALADATIAAMNGNQVSLNRVADWARQTRARFDLLIADRDVLQIFYALGRAGERGDARLREGWARDLFRNGTYNYRDANGQPQTLNLGIGAWANNNNRIIPAQNHNHVHDNHYHVTLRG